MHEFEELINCIWKTTMDAQEIMEEACENKNANPDLAGAYYRIAGNRLTDVDMLIKQAEQYLAKAENSQHSDFDDMDILWSADRRRINQAIARVKIYMDMYR